MLALAVIVIEIVIVVLAGLSGLLAVIAFAIAFTFLIARRHASPRPYRPYRLSASGQIKLWCGEIAAGWSIFLFAMPLERWLMARNRTATRAGVAPVLLIHGYVNNAGALWRLWLALTNSGVGVHTLNLEPVYTSIDNYAPLIAKRITEIRALTGAAGVTLVCHSMGGLAARAYLRDCAQRHTEAAVAKLITLGTPHHGTVHARIEFSPNGKQMVPGNPWLADLAAHERSVWPCPLVSVYSLDDNLVAPQLSAHLEGARNIALSGIGHMSLPLSKRVIEIVLGEIG